MTRFRPLRRALAALAVLMTLASPVRAGEGELVIGISQFPANWHPAIEGMVAKTYVLGMALRPLSVYDAQWRLVCLLCRRVPALEQGTAARETRADGATGIAVTYTLDERAVWGDGVPVTTEDVLFSLQVGRHPQNGYANADIYSRDILDITVKDAHTFTVHRAKPLCTYAELNDFTILPAHLERKVFEADPANYRQRSLYETDTTNPGLYNGPYRIAKVEPGALVVLEANPHWWGAKPAFPRVIVRAIENTAALEANLLAGQLDMIPGEVGLPLDQALGFEKRNAGRWNIVYKPGLFYEHIDINLDQPILADKRVRQALVAALDRTAMSRQLFAGRQPVADGPVSPLDRVFVPDTRHWAYDPALAARLLDEAGWTGRVGAIRANAKGERLTLDLATTAGNRSRELVEQVLQAEWKKIGVEARIANEPARVLFGQSLRERHFKGMALFAWLSGPENIPRTTFHSTMIPTQANGWAGQNFTGYANPEIDRVLDDLETVCEPKANRALWTRLQETVAEDLPALPLFFRTDATILPKGLDGVVPTGHQYPSTLWIESWRPAR